MYSYSAENGKPDIEFGNDVERDLGHLLSSCKLNLKNYDKDFITRAFYWCVEGHKNKHRKSGDPYYTHPLHVAIIVVNEIPLDSTSVVTALLHDITKSDIYTIKDIESEFGHTVAELVDNISKIQRIESSNFEHLEDYTKLLLSLFKDVRIILVKLADRLHNMRTLQHLPEYRQREIAEETLEIFAPFANRFGLGNLKWELEDLSFKFLHPRKYKEIRDKLNLTRKEREEYLRLFTDPLKEHLKKADFIKNKNVSFEVSSRVKHIYSIYNKTLIRQKPLEELYDLYAVRIILDTEEPRSCYLALGVLSELYKQVPETYKNYISNPKKNGYQSIHTAVIGPGGKLVEVQIRTRQMHLIAEKGVAAHFKYKRGFLPAESVFDDENVNKWMEVVRNIFENSEGEDPERLLQNVRRNLLLDDIYVLTPDNEFVNLPKDSSPLDFAYHIHTEIGEHCIGAKVNGRVVPLDYHLKPGDRIEILTSDVQQPSREWLDFTVTHKARSAIHKYLKLKKKKIITEGKEIWNRILGDMLLTIDENEFKMILEAFKFNKKEDFYDALRKDEIDQSVLIDILNEKIIENESYYSVKKSNAVIDEPPLLKDTRNGKPQNGHPLENNLPIRFGKCCYPVFGDHIVGFVDSDSNLAIHRRSCKEILPEIKKNSPGLFPLDWTWSLLTRSHYDAKLMINGKDDVSAINDLSSVFARYENTELKGLSFDSRDSEFFATVTVSVEDVKTLKDIIEEINKIKSVKTVDRFNKKA